MFAAVTGACKCTVFPLGTVLSRLQYAVSFENYKLKLIEISEEMNKNIYKKKKD